MAESVQGQPTAHTGGGKRWATREDLSPRTPVSRPCRAKSAIATTQADVSTLTVCGARLFVPQCFRRRHASGPACWRIRGNQRECHHHDRAKDDRGCALHGEAWNQAPNQTL